MLCGHYITQLGGKAYQAVFTFPAFPQNRDCRPTLPRVQESLFSGLRTFLTCVWCPGSEVSDLEWAGMGRGFVPRSLYQYSRFRAKSLKCFMRIPPKLLLCLLSLRASFHVLNLLGCPGRTSPDSLLLIPYTSNIQGSTPFFLLASQIFGKESRKDTPSDHTHTHKRAHLGIGTLGPLPLPRSRLTYLRKYLWPVGVKVISQPGGSGSSSVTS